MQINVAGDNYHDLVVEFRIGWITTLIIETINRNSLHTFEISSLE